MDTATNLHQDAILRGVIETINSESPRQDPQRTCTRGHLCTKEGCLVCATPPPHGESPPSHVRNLNVPPTSSNSVISPSIIVLPQPPADHAISTLTTALLLAIQDENIEELTNLNEVYNLTLRTNLDILSYDRTALRSALATAKQITTSHTAANTPLPASPPNGPTFTQNSSTPSASFKPPKLVTANWSGQSYDFYPWLSSIQRGFNLTRCDDSVKVVLTLQAIPLNKQGSFVHITNWQDFKTCLIEEFGSIDTFGRDVNQLFDLLPRYESIQEVAEDLSTKIKTLQANLKVIQQFHDLEDLQSVALTQSLVHNIIRSLPMEGRSSFNEKFQHFRSLDPANVRPPATFQFLAQYVICLEKDY